MLRYVSLSRTSYANGWDGYFYINQVRSLMEEGKMDVPDVSLVYPLMMLIQLFTNDYVLSYKLLCCILAGVFTASLFLLAWKWSKNYSIALLVGSISLFSPHLTYFAAQYPKNLLGVVLFIWLLYFADSKSKLVAILFLVLNFFGHRVTAVLGLMFVLAYAFRQKLAGLTPNAIGVLAVVLIAAGFFLPGLLNLFDVVRFNGVLSAYPQFAPYSFVKSFGLDLISGWWLMEIVGCCVVFLIAVGYAIRYKDIQLIIILLLLALLIFPFFEWSVDGPAVRFFLLFVLLCPLLLIFLLRSVKIKYILGVLSVVLVLFSFFSYQSYSPDKHDPPYRLYDKILSKLPGDSIDLIIAHKGLAEYIVYSKGVDAMSWIPEYELDKRRLWRVAEGVKEVQFNYYLGPDDLAFVHRLSPSYSLVREDCWNKFISQVKRDRNDELLMEFGNWKNPDRVRPRYMLRNK